MTQKQNYLALSQSLTTSKAEYFRALPYDVQMQYMDGISDEVLLALMHDWDWWARPNQRTPQTNWVYWLILAGRGYGKTRVGAEWTREQVKTNKYVNLIGATIDDARDIMIEGESGILQCCSKSDRPSYVVSKRRLEWPNGARSLIFTADEPERLRGKQHAKIWADEMAAWRYAEAWTQAQMGLRLGRNPQACITTTPKPLKIVRDLIADPDCHVTRGTTYDNRSNLAPTFYSAVIKAYEGTRIGRQELMAEVLDDNPLALFKQADIDKGRIAVVDFDTLALERIVVGVDPAVTSSEDSDETGIVGGGKKTIDGVEHYYVLIDASLMASVNEWGQKSVETYHALKADRLVAEVNNGGDLVESLLRNVDQNVSYNKVHATRGKARRAEPVAALYEQGRVHHVGSFETLENQMCAFNPIEPEANGSPDRMDALVWMLTELSGISNTGLIDFYEAKVKADKEDLEKENAFV